MIPKVECCLDALRGGVARAHIVDGRILHAILLEVFTDRGVGTLLTMRPGRASPRGRAGLPSRRQLGHRSPRRAAGSASASLRAAPMSGGVGRCARAHRLAGVRGVPCAFRTRAKTRRSCCGSQTDVIRLRSRCRRRRASCSRASTAARRCRCCAGSAHSRPPRSTAASRAGSKAGVLAWAPGRGPRGGPGRAAPSARRRRRRAPGCRRSTRRLELDVEVQQQLLDFAQRLRRPYHEILGVPRDADARTIKKAYFALSKRLHPDRYFRRRIGAFAPLIDACFKKLLEAYELLSDPTTRAEVQARAERRRRCRSGPPASAAVAPPPARARRARSRPPQRASDERKPQGQELLRVRHGRVPRNAGSRPPAASGSRSPSTRRTRRSGSASPTSSAVPTRSARACS